MHHFATTLCAGITVTVLFGGAALTPTAVEAARTSNVEKSCPKRDDRCVQGGGQGEEDQVASEPEVRE
jgi:hypothetical protein